MNILWVFFTVLLFLVLVVLVSALIELAEANRIVAKKGGIRYAFQKERNRADYTELGDISPELIAVVISSEDPNFFEHHGYDFGGMRRAIKKNIRTGRIVAGGSTITQQLCKNVFLTREKTFKRKILELYISVRMERALKKQEILEWYFNILDFDEGVIGILPISMALFQKRPCQTRIREAIVIAGASPCPRLYLPGKELYHRGFEKCVRVCFQYGGLFSKDDLDALKAMTDRDDPRMEKKYREVSQSFCEAKNVKENKEKPER